MEDELDDVANGERPWPPVVREFYEPLRRSARGRRRCAARRAADRRGLREVRQADDQALGPLRAVPRVHRLPGVQEHAPARRRRREQQPEATDEKCDECESPMVIKRGRFGQFLACSRYPECKGRARCSRRSASPARRTAGEIVEKRSKRGRTFYSLRQLPELRLHELVAAAEAALPDLRRPASSPRARGTAKCTNCDWKGDSDATPSRNSPEPRRDSRPARDRQRRARQRPRTRHVRIGASTADDGASRAAASSRRRARSLAAAAAAAVAGCGDGKRATGATATPAPQPRPRAGVGTRGGILRTYNFDAMTPDTLDPHLTQMGPIANVHSAIFSQLLRYEDERAGTIAPDLAAAHAGAAGRTDVRHQAARRRARSTTRRASATRVPADGRPRR